jgi:hypothetical protein
MGRCILVEVIFLYLGGLRYGLSAEAGVHRAIV